MSLLNILSSGIRFAEEASDTASTATETGKSILNTLKDVAKNPITLGVAATVAISTGSYYGYKAYKNKKNK
ncbi:MAG: hypothetical protein ACRCXT_03680 [Paraclostridium sp.]